MSELLSAAEAARRLGVAPATLYAWLGLSDRGLLVIRGVATAIDYFQGGSKGQGRIRIDEREVERIRELMRVVPRRAAERRPTRVSNSTYPGITVRLGRPSATG